MAKDGVEIVSDSYIERKARVVYFSHGGGPLPILGDPGHRAMAEFLTHLPALINRPEAILVISAHWEAHPVTLQVAPHPPMLYDYYGFPPSAYEVTYPAPGSPDLAARIARLLETRDIATHLDPDRGFDHGLFIPLKLMYPQADIPALQISLLRGLDPAAHIALGVALRPLMRENLLMVGSGSSFHNLRAFFSDHSAAADPANDAFQNWLIETCAAPMTEEERTKRLVEWESAPSARYCHPREEHLMPLHVCVGAAGESAQVVFDDRIMGKRCVAFLW